MFKNHWNKQGDIKHFNIPSIKNYTFKHRNDQSTNILWILDQSMYISYPNISKYKIIRLNMCINFNDKFYRIIKETAPFSNLAKDNKSAYLIFYSFLPMCSTKTRIG